MRVEVPRHLKRLLALLSATATALAIVWLGTVARAQFSGMEAYDFKVQLENYPPPNEMQIKSFLEGDKAQSRSNGLILITAAKLSYFSSNGMLEMIAESPSCVFDSTPGQRTISSTNHLRIRSANERFTLEGDGFFLQTNSVLIVSNRVHTVLRNLQGRSLKP